MTDLEKIKIKLKKLFALSVRPDLPKSHRETHTMQSINSGMRERSIVELKNNHYKLSHPTEKPVRLAERILALISGPGDTIYDPFMGVRAVSALRVSTPEGST
jgi:site-specific DNA-methyltransferase (adenine-specific)